MEPQTRVGQATEGRASEGAPLEGGVAVVTGGASGIGAAVVERLGAAGALPVVWDLDPPTGGIACDVSDGADVGRAMDETISRAGPPSFLVACAGIGSFGSVDSITRGDWDRVLSVNLTGTMLCIQAAARVMSGGGAVVCLSSINGRVPDRGMAAYCCSKAGVDMLVKVAAAELGPRGVRVNAIAPGVTETPMSAGAVSVPGFSDGVVSRTPLGRLGQAGDIAEAVVSLLGWGWVTGESLLVDGGLALHSPIDMFGKLSDDRDSRRR